jgi:hypothetical protein
MALHDMEELASSALYTNTKSTTPGNRPRQYFRGLNDARPRRFGLHVRPPAAPFSKFTPSGIALPVSETQDFRTRGYEVGSYREASLGYGKVDLYVILLAIDAAQSVIRPFQTYALEDDCRDHDLSRGRSECC